MRYALDVILSLFPYGAGLFMAVMCRKWYPDAPEYMTFVYFVLGYLFIAVPSYHKGE